MGMGMRCAVVTMTRWNCSSGRAGICASIDDAHGHARGAYLRWARRVQQRWAAVGAAVRAAVAGWVVPVAASARPDFNTNPR